MTWKSSRWVLITAILMLFTSIFLQPILNYFGCWNFFFPTTTIQTITIPNNKTIENLSGNTLNFKPSEVVPTGLQDFDISFEFKASDGKSSLLMLKTAPDHALR